VHLFGFIVRIFHDAQSTECQTEINLGTLTENVSLVESTQDLLSYRV
jgi:hypothetical protein